jgi:hypothetical protein
MAHKISQSGGSFQFTNDQSRVGFPVQPATGSIKVRHEQFGPLIKTTLTLDSVPQAVVNGTEYQGTKIYSFPQTRMLVLGTVATLQQKTTSATTTINASVTGAISLGTAVASATTLASGMIDFLPSTAFTSSATANVAGTAVSAALAASAQLDGTGTAKDLYLNTAYATTGDVDGDGTQTISGNICFTWVDLGDLPVLG